MSADRPRRPGPAQAAARAAWGVALLAAPAPVLRHVHGLDADHRAVVVARVLGARHVAQAAVVAARPTRTVLVAGAVVDVLHGLSMVGLAALDRRRTRAGLTDAGLAAGWAVASLLDAGRTGA